jgi:hypothetical protein
MPQLAEDEAPLRPQRWAAIAAVGLATAYVLWEVHLPLILRNTTTTFAELGVHVHEPAYLRDHVLPMLTGWSPDYFAGAPLGTFYFPLAPIPALLLSIVMPYNVAFKLASASGLFIMPVCAYAMGRLFDEDRLTSACLSVATLPLLLLPITAIGGSIASTLSSEYPYAMALSLSALVLGLTARGMRTGRLRAATAALLALTILIHYLLGAMAVGGIVALVLIRPSWPRVRWALPVLATAGAVAGFSLFPFVLRQRYAGGPVYQKTTAIASNLMLPTFSPVVVIAVIGAVIVLVRLGREPNRFGLFLLAMSLIAAIAFAVVPTGRLWNARFLPFWFFWASLLGGYGVARAAASADAWRRANARGRELDAPAVVRMAAPFVLLAVVVVIWDSPFAAGLITDSRYDVSDLSKLAYVGYERSPDRAEYKDFVGTVRRVARDHGCGRAHWEWNEAEQGEWTDIRTGIVTLMPYWTHGCIGSMQGMFIHASPTAAQVAQANGHLAENGDTGGEVAPEKMDMARGVEDLRVLGVRYFVATSTATQTAADATPGLRLVDQTKRHGSRQWTFYEVEDVHVVEPLAFEPVVVPGSSSSITSWKRLSTRWFGAPGDRSVLAADDGPSSWTRRSHLPADLPERAAPSTSVSNVRLGDDAVSFQVSRPGVPVLVKVSYFPNWQVTGARGPWRVTPNYMVVVPTGRTVRLHYTRTAVEHAGWVITLLGLAAIALLARAKPVDMPAEVPVEDEKRRGREQRGAARRPAPRQGTKAPQAKRKRR